MVLNSGRCRNAFMQDCLREISFHAARFQCQIKANWVEGVSNRHADALSRWHLGPNHPQEFWNLVQGLQVHETFVYEGLLNFSHDW